MGIQLRKAPAFKYTDDKNKVEASSDDGSIRVYLPRWSAIDSTHTKDPVSADELNDVIEALERLRDQLYAVTPRTPGIAPTSEAKPAAERLAGV